jgi:RNA polymerase sigma factor (sigma-70 family)
VTVTTEQARASHSEAQQAPAPGAATGPPFETIFLEHWPRIYRVLVQLVGDRDEAEDLALETFWQLYRRPPDQAGKLLNLGGWLYRVATNLGLNAIRARKRRARYEADTAQAALADPAETFDRQEERRRVRQALAEMNPRQTQLLILRYAGLTYRELAEALGLSVNSIGALLVRAEGEFEKRYRQLNPDEGGE